MAVFLFLATFLFFVDVSYAATIQVTTAADEFAAGGGCSLREAITAADRDVTVGGCSAGNGDDVIQLSPQSYLIVAGGAAEEDAGRSGDLDIHSDMTIVSGPAGAAIVSSDRLERIFHIATGATVRLEGVSLFDGRARGSRTGLGGCILNEGNLTIVGGIFQNCEAAATGGGILNAGTLRLEDVEIRNCVAVRAGGGLINYSPNGAVTPTATIVNSLFQQNRVSTETEEGERGFGGAIGNQGVLILEQSQFQSNEASGGAAIYNQLGGRLNMTGTTLTLNRATFNGGALWNENGAVLINNGSLIENAAAQFGGAVYQSGASANSLIQTSVFRGNQTTGLDGDAEQVAGGAIYNDLGEMSLVQTSLTGNISAGRGGAIANRSTLTLQQSTLSENSSTREGGGIVNFNPDRGLLTILNSTLYNNRTDGSGGGLLQEGGLVRISASTAVLNVADADGDGTGSGGGIVVSAGTVEVRNSLIDRNANVTGGDLRNSDCIGPVMSTGHNILGSSDGCGFVAMAEDRVGDGTNPLNFSFAGLADNGGPTQTAALMGPDNIALDAGDTESCPPVDQRGVARQGSCDIGAYEVACGDGSVGGGEACDDGNASDEDACSNSCVALAQTTGGGNQNQGRGSDGTNGGGNVGMGGGNGANTVEGGTPAGSGGGCALAVRKRFDSNDLGSAVLFMLTILLLKKFLAGPA